MQKYARFVDPEHRLVWEKLGTPKGEVGMILRKITTEFKFVSDSRSPLLLAMVLRTWILGECVILC